MVIKTTKTKEEEEEEKETQEFFGSVCFSVVIHVRPIDFRLLFKGIERTCLRHCSPRYLERGSTGMSIMDIGILTGFKPEQTSLDKVIYLSIIM